MMNSLLQIWRWLIRFTRRGRLEREMEEEMRFHYSSASHWLTANMRWRLLSEAAAMYSGLSGSAEVSLNRPFAETSADPDNPLYETGKKSDTPPRRRKNTPYLNLKNATCSLPSFNLTIN